MLIMQRFFKKIQTVLDSDTAVSHLLLFFIKLCRHWSCEILIAALELSIGFMTGFSYFGIALWIVAVILLLLIAGSAAYKKYDSDRKSIMEEKLDSIEKDRELLRKVKDSTLVLNGTASKNIYRVARDIKNIGWNSSLKDIRTVYGFQVMAFAVCKEVYDLLHNHLGLKGHWVTVYQCFEGTTQNGNRKRPKCKMIAYANATKQEPLSYQEEYTIPHIESLPTDIEFHTRIFAEGDVTPRILMTKEDVQGAFKIHKKVEFVKKTFISILVYLQLFAIEELCSFSRLTVMLNMDLEKHAKK